MIDDQFAIRMAGVGKRYTKFDDQPMIINTLLRFRARTRRDKLWALRGIDLEVDPGESVGIIGRNGAGKTTMLQLLAGVTGPTEGVVAVRGRIAPLIAVGVGFHPELTGRENVYVNGTILGLRRREIDQRLDEIIAFSEIEPFIDTPVKFYSSGMSVRLGFAVAIQSDPDVLLVDEVLAVGDLAFQWKCFDRMMEVRRSQGTTVVVVSHNLSAVRKLCDRTMVLHQGLVDFHGDTNDAIERFHDLMGEHRELGEGDDESDGTAVIESCELRGPDGKASANFETGSEATFHLVARFHRDVDEAVVGFGLKSEQGQPVYSEGSPRNRIESVKAGDRVALDITVPLTLTTGSYRAEIGIFSGDLVTTLARSRPLAFYVAGRSMVGGPVDLRGEFALSRMEPDDPALGNGEGRPLEPSTPDG